MSVTLFHAPNTRSTAVLALLDELAAPYDLHAMNMKAGEQRKPAFLAINPMGKVPAILDDGALVTEQGAIFIHLADRFPANRLAPPIGDPLRGPYLRWMVFYGSSFEPAMVDHALKREPGSPAMMPYGDYETTVRTLVHQLSRGPYLLGETFSAADILWGMALQWITLFGLLPADPAITAYIERVTARPAFAKARAVDAGLAEARDAEAARGAASQQQQ